jgi:CRP-like cAMP-binding protein
MPKAYFELSGLLQSLPFEEKQHLQNSLQHIALHRGDVVQIPNARITRLVFPVEGVIALLSATNTGIRIETGIVGREGFIGIPLFHEVDRSSSQAIVLIAGQALVISAESLMTVLANCPQLRLNLLHFAHVYEVQVEQTALAHGGFTIESRLARWLLMYDDRVAASNIAISHELIAVMLAVRRSGVTVALQDLEGKRIIKSTRNKVEILNRNALIELAGGSYGVPEAEYARLIGEASVRSHPIDLRKLS